MVSTPQRPEVDCQHCKSSGRGQLTAKPDRARTRPQPAVRERPQYESRSLVRRNPRTTRRLGRRVSCRTRDLARRVCNEDVRCVGREFDVRQQLTHRRQVACVVLPPRLSQARRRRCSAESATVLTSGLPTRLPPRNSKDSGFARCHARHCARTHRSGGLNNRCSFRQQRPWGRLRRALSKEGRAWQTIATPHLRPAPSLSPHG